MCTAAVRARAIAGAAVDVLVREFEDADSPAAAALPEGGRRVVTGGINVAGAPGSGTGAESRRGEGKREEQQDFGPWVDHVASPLHLATAPAAATEAETAKRRGEQEERGEREGGRGKHDTPGTQSVCRWDPGERESDRTVLAKMRVETADIHSSSSDIHSSSSSQQHPVLSLPRQAHVPKEVASAAAGAAGGHETTPAGEGDGEDLEAVSGKTGVAFRVQFSLGDLVQFRRGMTGAA